MQEEVISQEERFRRDCEKWTSGLDYLDELDCLDYSDYLDELDCMDMATVL